MTPLKQTDTSPETGNCFQAAVASLLDLPLDEVPHFIDEYDDWWSEFNIWLVDNGFGCWSVDHPSFIDEDEYYLAMGHTIRGTYHAVLYQNGRLAHDPHPSNDGLIEPREIYVVRKL